jgi:hypothetical protein
MKLFVRTCFSRPATAQFLRRGPVDRWIGPEKPITSSEIMRGLPHDSHPILPGTEVPDKKPGMMFFVQPRDMVRFAG